jgi:hypothetical protein
MLEPFAAIAFFTFMSVFAIELWSYFKDKYNKK